MNLRENIYLQKIGLTVFNTVYYVFLQQSHRRHELPVMLVP